MLCICENPELYFHKWAECVCHFTTAQTFYGRQINSKLENQENDKSKYIENIKIDTNMYLMINGETAVSSPWREYVGAI